MARKARVFNALSRLYWYKNEGGMYSQMFEGWLEEIVLPYRISWH